MKAYKVFNYDWTCRNFQYKIGEIYEMEEEPIICRIGFHACKKVVDCFNYYKFDSKNKVAEVELLGVIKEKDSDKLVTNRIKIVKEISWNLLLGLVNSGDNNSGYRNSGDNNSGYFNSGYYNSGDNNSGYYNSGDYNSGNKNSGDYNSGDKNSGDYNFGDKNSGDYNSGYYNSGYYNYGNNNSGDYNSGDYNSGYFNSNTPDKIRIFNKFCDILKWDMSIKPKFLKFELNKWIIWNNMNNKEKKENKKAFVTDGYLKTYDYKEGFINSFNHAKNKDKILIFDLPNFDADIFFEISGIDLRNKTKEDFK